jgi:tetratricopeptide (TPR) repeat protein
MKRERRHELHTNALARWLADTIEAIKPHANTIVLVVCAAALVFAGVSWWRWYSASASQQTWDALARALHSPGAAGALDDLVEKYPGSDVARWAAVLAADTYLRDGCDQVLTSKEMANQQLQKAVDHYATVLEDQRLDPALRERATFGLARAYEALSGTRRSEGELDQAAALYEQLLNDWPQGAYAKMAARRAAELKRTDIRKFYDQLAQYDPRKTSGPEPIGPGQGLLFDPSALPDEPLFQRHDLLKEGPILEKPVAPEERQPAFQPTAATKPEPAAAKPPEKPTDMPAPKGPESAPGGAAKPGAASSVAGPELAPAHAQAAPQPKSPEPPPSKPPVAAPAKPDPGFPEKKP